MTVQPAARPATGDSPTLECMSETDLSTLALGIAAALDREVTGRIVTAADAEWDVERLGWDLHVDQHPVAVVHVSCATTSSRPSGSRSGTE